MQFKLEITRPVADLRRIEDALQSLDPAALVDIDPAGRHLRVASSIGPESLVRLFAQAGYPVTRSELVDVPSECCGGCGG